MAPVNKIGYLLNHTASIMNRQSDQVLQERLGIGISQFKLLMMLQRRQGIQQRTLAEWLGQTEASISRQIKLLVAKGMLTAKVNPENRREHITVTTPKGEKVGRAAQEVLAEYHAPAFEQFSDKQLEQLLEILNKLHHYCCQEGKPYACDRPFDI